MSVTVYLGPPGTGKTRTLVDLVARHVKDGGDSGRVGYVSFTKAAVNEAVGRVGLAPEELPNFKTLHALCFRLKNLSTAMVMGAEHYADLGQRLGVELTGGKKLAEGLSELAEGDKALGVVELARARHADLRQTWEQVDADVQVDWPLVDLVDRGLRRYKELNFLVDFSGMLEGWLKDGRTPELDLLVVDEAQDLSALQWQVVEKLMAGAAWTVLAGDDDQAIYRWAGVDPANFQAEVKAADRVETLGQSWRLPRAVHRLAVELAARIPGRLPKPFSPRDADGTVERLSSVDEADLSSGRWLALVRNRFLAGQLVELCRREGFFYEHEGDSPARWPAVKAALTWETLRRGAAVTPEAAREMLRYWRGKPDRIKLDLALGGKDSLSLARLKACGMTDEGPWFEALAGVPSDEAEYIRAAMRRGERLKEAPRVRISTVHGAKGAEADNVLLLTDQAYKTWQGAERDPDDEARVFYVGVTRARERLCVVQPQTRYFFDL